MLKINNGCTERCQRLFLQKMLSLFKRCNYRHNSLNKNHPHGLEGNKEYDGLLNYGLVLPDIYHTIVEQTLIFQYLLKREAHPLQSKMKLLIKRILILFFLFLTIETRAQKRVLRQPDNNKIDS